MRAFRFGTVFKAAGFLFFLTVFVSLHGSQHRSPRYFDAAPVLIRAESLAPDSLGAVRASGVPLRLSKAWELTAEHPAFGGVSALWVKDGRIRAIVDVGGRLDWSIKDNAHWPAALSLLPKGCGDTASHFDRDTESLVVDDERGLQWIGFEVRNIVCRLADNGSAVMRAPVDMRSWPKTGGAEAMARLNDGRFLIFAESTKDGDDPLTPLLVFDRDPASPRARVRQLSYRAPPGTRPVDAAALPDGRLLILNRRFDLPFRFSVILAIADPALPAGQTVLDAQPIAWFAKGLSAENWEALAVEDLGKGRARIWMASDDNFMGIQNTLLLRLDWQGAEVRPAR